jgi:hypothetical protein
VEVGVIEFEGFVVLVPETVDVPGNVEVGVVVFVTVGLVVIVIEGVIVVVVLLGVCENVGEADSVGVSLRI